MDLRTCDTVLVVTEGESFLIDACDALREDGVAVLLVPGFDPAVTAMQSGFRPDAILVDLVLGPERFAPFLRALLDEPSWRTLPVVGAPEASTSLFQIFPRERARELPFPGDVGRLRELLNVVCSDAGQAGAEPRP